MLADLRQANADAAAEVLSDAGFAVSTATVDVSSRESVRALVDTASALGEITGVIHAAGVSPSQAAPQTILSVDLYGTALVLEEFGTVIAPGGAAVVTIITPLAKDELTGPRGAGYRRMIELCPAGRAGTPDEVGAVGALPDGSGRDVHHRQRLPDGRRSHRRLPVRRSRPELSKRDYRSRSCGWRAS
jgi:hypothetical protein